MIASEGEDGRYAVKGRPEWCVVGPLSERKDESRFHRNWLSVKELRTEKVSGHNFTVTDCREDGTGGLL